MSTDFTLPEDFDVFDIDFGVDLTGVDPIDWSDFVNPSPGGGSTVTLWGGIENYKKSLMQGANYFDINDVDNVDDWYNNAFTSALRGMGATPETYFKAVSGTPEYLKTFNSPATDLTITDAFNRISKAGSPEEITTALSEYYGYDVPLMDQTFTDFGGNLASHSGSSTERLKEFHSIVEPILLEQIPYLQAVEGLSYEDALVEAYARDPMLQALYFKYDVSPIRQTEDGSTYLYDPFSFSEIRTYESKDPNLARMATNVIAGFALSAFLGPVIGKFVGSLGATGTTGTALTNALTSASVAGLQGADLKTALTSGMFAGLGTYATPVVTNGLDASGLTAEVLEKYGIVQEDFANALASATMEVGAGGNVEDALLSAATSYLRNAGIPGVETPKFVEDIRNAGRFIDDMVQSVLPEGFLDSLDFGNLSESQVAEFAKQAEDALSLINDAYDEDIGGDPKKQDKIIKLYDRMIDSVGGVDNFNKMTRSEMIGWLVNNGTQADRDFYFSLSGASKYRAMFNTLGQRGVDRPALNIDPSLFRKESTILSFDKNGNLLSDSQLEQTDVAYQVQQFEDGTYEVTKDTVTVDLDQVQTGDSGGGGGGGDSSSADGGSGQPPATDTTTPTDAIDGGGATGGGTTTTGGGGTTSPTPDTTAPSTEGGGGGGAVVVSGGSDGDTTEVNTPAASSQANYTQQELDDAIAKALAEAQKNDPTEFDQADLDAAVAEAVKEVIENDPTDFTQEDINTAVDNALNKQSKEYEQQITELKGAAEKARIKAANDARKAAEAKAAVAAAKAAKQSKAKIAAAEAKQKQAEEQARKSAADARKSKAEANKAEEQRRQAESQRDAAKRAQAQAEAEQAKAEAAKAEAEATAAKAVQANKEAQDKKADADEAKSNAAKAREAAEKEIDAARKAQKEAEADAAEARAAQKAAEAQAASDAAEAANQAARDAEAAYEQGYGEGAASTGAGSDAGDADSGDTGTGVTDGEGTGGGVGSGDGTGEGTGSGTGTGSGSGAGDGSGTGAGSGTGDGSGMFAGLGGVTGEIFDDYVKFKKSAVMPTRQARPKLKGYTAPPVGLFRNII